MKKLLCIDCSPRIKGSHSRSIANYFESCWKSSNPNGNIIYRDLAINPIPHIKNETVKAYCATS
ncbi:NAD(P)H-dependent oxidoreductase [Flavivirga sp. 57AJ16]|uniref:NAD(P)H-dependent oxidoreductase n=1 Tax=Flavivirga sp. 57AJ16 TaxID=3025307 RepID=UPI0034E03D34